MLTLLNRKQLKADTIRAELLTKIAMEVCRVGHTSQETYQGLGYGERLWQITECYIKYPEESRF